MDMKKTTKQTLVALALAGAFSSAQAATISLDEGDFPYDLGPNPTDENAYSVTHDIGSFLDIFTFTLTGALPFNTISSAVSLLLPGVDGGDSSYEIDNGTLSLWSDPEGDGAGGGDVQLGTVAYGDANGVLSVNNVEAGAYYWAVAGDAVGTQGGVYLYSANTVPIPEPETYAMMLAGLGMLGFMGKRRMKNSRQSLNFA
jgi:hypothetical protein